MKKVLRIAVAVVGLTCAVAVAASACDGAPLPKGKTATTLSR